MEKWMHALAICSLMSNERPYVEEWIHFHAAQGVTLFRIYVDRSRPEVADDGTMDLLSTLARDFNVEIVEWAEPGPRRQILAFEDGLKALRGRAEWAAFIDCDEFIRSDEPLVPWLQALPDDVDAVGATQLVFGSAGRLTKPSIPVLQAYCLRATVAYQEHAWFKSIARPDRVERFTNNHMVYGARFVLGDGLPMELKNPGCATRIPERGVRLHHYMLKSRDEFMTKRARGAVSDGAMPGFKRFTMQYLERDANCNVVPDDTLARAAEPFAAYKRQEAEAMKVWGLVAH